MRLEESEMLRAKSRGGVLKAASPYLLLIPVTVLLLIFVIGLVSGIAQSFGYAPFMGQTEFTLDYYIEAANEYMLGESVAYSLYLATVSTLPAVVGAIALSAALVKVKAGNNLKMMALNIPLSVAHVVVALLVVIMFGSSGLFARCLYALGIIDSAQSLPSVIGAYSGWGIILVFFFKEVPYITLCTIPLMANIGNRYSEASACLGASPMRTFFKITLPLCKIPIIRCALVVFAFVFGSYEIPYLIGASNPRPIAVLAFYQFQNYDIVNRSYAMTFVTLMIVITLAIAIVYFVLIRRGERGTIANG